MRNRQVTIAERLCVLSRANMEAAEIVMPKIKNPEMQARVKEQLRRSSAVHEKAERLLREQKPGGSAKTNAAERLRGRIFRFRARFSRNPQRISRLLRRETVQRMGILGRMVDLFPDSSLKSRALAEEYLMLQQRYLEGLSAEFWP